MPYDDIKLMYEKLRKQNEYFFVAGETIGARALVKVNGAGAAVQADANDIDVVGINSKAEVYLSGVGFDAQVKGVTQGVADAVIEAGKNLKAGWAGKVGELIDASLVGSSIIAVDGNGVGTWTPATGGIGNTSRIHARCANAADTFAILVLAEASDGSFQTCEITLNGTTSVPVSNASVENDEWSAILGVSCLDGLVGAGIIRIGVTGAKKTVLAMAAGTSHAGMEFPVDGRAYNETVSVVYAGTNHRAHIGLYGYNELNALTGEVLRYRDAGAAFGSDNKYREIVAVLVGSMLAADTVAVKVTATEDDENRKIGKSLEAASGQGVEFDLVIG